ncbi:MAG: hypothetical protein AAB679_01060, partial [Patescibacteria group bacterium]
FFFKKGPVGKVVFKEDEPRVEDFFFRMFVGIVLLPLMGVVFNMIGYIGKFILLPFKFLQF